MPGRILVVEGDVGTAQVMACHLRRSGFAVYVASSGLEAVQTARAVPPDMVVLDLTMPDMDGFELFRELQRERDLPVIMLAARGDEIERVVAFEVGADDYMTKPFSPRELVGRVKAILRRSGHSEADPDSVVRVGPFAADFVTYEVTVAGRTVNLTATEFQLLKLLALHPIG